jgi:hypothetical protein
MDSSLNQITLEALKPEAKMLTISDKIKKLEYAKRNLTGEYEYLIAKRDKRNLPLEISLEVSIDSINTVLESLKRERG